MDWNEVTVQDLLQSLREVDWGSPKGPGDFLGRFSAPSTFSKWTARLKANVYYFRANYLLICLISYLALFLRNPLALVGVLLVGLAVFCTNDSVSSTLNDHLLRLVRRLHPPTALKIRARTLHAPAPLNGSQLRRRPTRVYILSVPRSVFVLGCLVAAGLLLRVSAAWRTLALGTALGLGLPLLHATFRSPNLKAKLSNARDDFKHMWKSYQAEMTGSLNLGPSIGIMGMSPVKSSVDYSR